jgi:hypothetical protein
MKFRTRRFQPRDEAELNALFNAVAGLSWSRPPRTLDVMRWEWYHSPGGAVDSWVIETEDVSGMWRIVGHHGLCPLRFTLGEHDLLCAKTINTMVAPEYRAKFLYLRFEKECLTEADARFDATYSIAPGTTRLRSALGYEGSSKWIWLERGIQSHVSIDRLLARLAFKYPCNCWIRVRRVLASISAPAGRKWPFELMEHSSEQAMRASFFLDFWKEARQNAGMAPRRDVRDLTWRFWKHPGYPCCSTLVHAWPGGGGAYCIVNMSNPWAFYLEDIFLAPPRPDLLDTLLDSLFVWCAQRGAFLLRFSTTLDGQPPELLEVFIRKMHMHPLQRFRRSMELPRRFSALGKAKIGHITPCWNATNILQF